MHQLTKTRYSRSGVQTMVRSVQSTSQWCTLQLISSLTQIRWPWLTFQLSSVLSVSLWLLLTPARTGSKLWSLMSQINWRSCLSQLMWQRDNWYHEKFSRTTTFPFGGRLPSFVSPTRTSTWLATAISTNHAQIMPLSRQAFKAEDRRATLKANGAHGMT